MLVNISKQPFIKWSGSKRKQAPYIVHQFPKEIDTYYEPFLGGGSVLHELLNEIALGNIKVNKIVCSDLNKDLMNIWNLLKDNREELLDYYTENYEKLRKQVDYKDAKELTHDDIKLIQPVYYENREKYNNMSEDDPERAKLLYWISRTCFNGLIRYNPSGKFNTPFHVGGRYGIKPEELEKVLDSWYSVIEPIKDKISFICGSYDDIIKDAHEGDVIYMDPPYENTGSMYFMADTFNSEHMYDVIENLTAKNVKILLSYDGTSGKDDRTCNVRKFYTRHVYVDSGHSSFKKLRSKTVKTNPTDIVYDSLYLNY